MADDWIGQLVKGIMSDVRGGKSLPDALARAADSLAQHAFVPPANGPGWLCAQCKQGRDAKIHTGGG